MHPERLLFGGKRPSPTKIRLPGALRCANYQRRKQAQSQPRRPATRAPQSKLCCIQTDQLTRSIAAAGCCLVSAAAGCATAGGQNRTTEGRREGWAHFQLAKLPPSIISRPKTAKSNTATNEAPPSLDPAPRSSTPTPPYFTLKANIFFILSTPFAFMTSVYPLTCPIKRTELLYKARFFMALVYQNICSIASVFYF